jgi:two-component system OmpR family sensor kinase
MSPRLPRPGRLSNRWRITAWILVVVLVVTVITGVVAVSMVKQRLTEKIDQELQDEVASLVSVFSVIDPEVLGELVDRPGIGSSSLAIVVIGTDGPQVVLPSGSTESPDPLPDLEGLDLAELRGRVGEPFEVDSVTGDPRYQVLVGQLDDGDLVVAARNLDERDEAVTTLLGVLVAVAVVASIVLTVVVSLVSGHVTRPLDAMIATAEGIGSGALHARVPTEGVEDVHRLATALNAMLDRLEQAFADKAASELALRRFVADASHELRTPLAAILGYAQLHQDGMADSPEQVDHAMARIAAEGERMRQLVEELLLLARLDHGRPADPAAVDVGGLVDAAVADARTIDPSRPITLTVDDGAAGATVEGDAAALRRAVDNLLANTRAHTPPGTPVTVSVAVDGAGGALTISVADAGPGIGPDEAAHVFERFYRAERSRARPGGSGLGLAIVAAIAQSHGGHAEVESVPGRGATFTITLPVAQAPMA